MSVREGGSLGVETEGNYHCYDECHYHLMSSDKIHRYDDEEKIGHCPCHLRNV